MKVGYDDPGMNSTLGADCLGKLNAADAHGDASLKIKTAANKALHSCNQCDFTGGTKLVVARHVKRCHVMKYPCDQCEYTESKTVLWKHYKSEHNELSYLCNQCDYKTARAHDLKQHKIFKHENPRYSCDQCDYATTQRGNLKTHKESKHTGTKSIYFSKNHS